MGLPYLVRYQLIVFFDADSIFVERFANGGQLIYEQLVHQAIGVHAKSFRETSDETAAIYHFYFERIAATRGPVFDNNCGGIVFVVADQ